MPKVSIIIPVYNAELFIRECLDSIRLQTFVDWECLLIDDGSIDKSGKICDEYAQDDFRFKVFHIQNSGVSEARNVGLKNMSGEWVTFVDSDDALAENTVDECVKLAETNSLDLLQFSLAKNKEFLNKSDGKKTDVLNSREFVHSKKMLICAGGGFYRTSIIKNNNLLFKSHMKLAEDQLFVYAFINKAKKFQKYDKCLYWYRENLNSATHKLKSGDLIYSLKTLTAFKKSNQLFEVYIDRINVYFLISIIYNNDINLCLTKNLIREANLSNTRMIDRGLPFLFYLVSKINCTFAILLVKLRKLFLRGSHA